MSVAWKLPANLLLLGFKSNMGSPELVTDMFQFVVSAFVMIPVVPSVVMKPETV